MIRYSEAALVRCDSSYLRRAVATIVGVLSPFGHLPFVGDVSYILHGKGDGAFVILLCVIAAPVAMRAPVVGIVSGGIVGFMLYRFQSVVNEAIEKIHRSAGGAGFMAGFLDRVPAAVYLE